MQQRASDIATDGPGRTPHLAEPREPLRLAEQRRPLEACWQMLSLPPGTVEAPPGLRAMTACGTAPAWIDIPGPGTVGAMLRALGHWSLDGPTRRFDTEDWWFRASFEAPPETHAGDCRELVFAGLAGRCQVWFNDEPLLDSADMHTRHTCTLAAFRASGNQLLMRFASLDQWLAGSRRARPRWRAPMVENQQLRWARQTLLGRTPGWSPPVAPLGPWRGIEWVYREQVRVGRLRLQSVLTGSTGQVRIDIDLTPLDDRGASIAAVQLVLERDGREHRQSLLRSAGSTDSFAGLLEIADVARWWPHTHGDPALYAAHVEVRMTGNTEPVALPLHRLGFRTLVVDTDGGDFGIRIDGVRIFCRGACWTPLDIVALRAAPEATRAALEQVRDAGMNMLRISGAMVAEDAAFFDACDALGILVWQDLMFASMDYPADDTGFAATVRDEVAQQLGDWQARASLAVLCGNSEAEQQAAMWGAPREQWSQPLFARDLADQVRASCPGVHYWPSSAHGGSLPQQPSTGTTSYYGVGAYLRPLDDARRSSLRFATECLAFANIPSAATLARIPGGSGALPHHPAWKARSPRDLGAGWDFDDVRDHYLQRLFGVDPVALRSRDPTRYLALGRLASAEAMAASFAEWRRAGSTCRGALVWFLRDLWAGAGWGLLDDRGTPKAAFQVVKRALAPVAVFLSDEGLNGLDVHVVNDPGLPLAATIELAAYRHDGLRLHHGSHAQHIAAHTAQAWPAAAWFDGFVDLSHAFRFGPAEIALVVATLLDAEGRMLGEAFHFPEGLPSTQVGDIGLRATIEASAGGDDSVWLTVATRDFAQSVQIDMPGFVAADNHFHLPPGGGRRVRLVPDRFEPKGDAGRRGSVQALNSRVIAQVRPI